MSFDIGAVVAKIDADISGFKKGIEEAQKSTEGFKEKMNGLKTSVGQFADKVSLISGAVGAGLMFFLKDASQEATNLERSMTTLDIIAGRFGESGTKAQIAAKELSKELRIGVSSSAEALQNLLKSGLNLDQASDLLKRFTNEAITGKSPQITLSQAVQNLSFAYATNNSALGNLSGVSENFNDIIERGRNKLIEEGMAVREITDEAAKYKGMIELTNLTLGSSDRFHGSLIDKQAQLSQGIIDTKVAWGEGLNPVLRDFISLFLDSGFLESLQLFAKDTLPKITEQLREFGGWIKENKELVGTFLKGLAIGFGALLIIAPLITLALHPFIAIFIGIGLAIAALYTAWQTNFWGIQDITMSVIGFLNNLFEATLKPIIQGLTIFITENWELIKAITKTTFTLIGEIIRIAWAIISGIILVALNVLTGNWKEAWEVIKQKASDVWESLKNIFESAKNFIGTWATSVKDKLIQPFSDAWNKISEYVNKIKDALDFTKRHSPSVVDIVTMGVKKVNNALDGLNFDTNISPHIGMSQIAPAFATPNMNQITISLPGAIIANEMAAQSIAEMIGDNIIKKVQMNVRI